MSMVSVCAEHASLAPNQLILAIDSLQCWLLSSVVSSETNAVYTFVLYLTSCRRLATLLVVMVQAEGLV